MKQYLYLVRVLVAERRAYALAVGKPSTKGSPVLSRFYTLGGAKVRKPRHTSIVDKVGVFRSSDELWELIENVQCLSERDAVLGGRSLVDESDDDGQHAA